VTAPASSANLGPGFDCLAVALELRNRVEITAGGGGEASVSVEGEGAGRVARDGSNLFVRAFVSVGADPAGLAFAALAAGLTVADIDVFANFARLAATALLGWWFLGFFEAVSWVVLVACIIPWVDAYSVWRGPTKVIVDQHRKVFTNFSFAFAIPGETSAANLGLPDLLFFALFLAASARWALRPRLTWLLLTLSFGATLALAVWGQLGGLPALPLLALGFLLANGDLIWRRLRLERAERSAETGTRSSGRSEP
jgi:hypothetical protein